MALRDFPTKTTKDWLEHYTCQSVDPKTLEKKWIKQIWEKYGIDAREVLDIPKKLVEKMWKKVSNEPAVNQMTCEQILRDLDAKSKKK